MPSKVVPLVTNETYHVFNRGVDKRQIFMDKVDYFRFHTSLQLFNAEDTAGSIYELRFNKDWIKKQKPLVKIHAYCLLGNHYHLLLTQVVDGGVSEFMKRLNGGFTSYFNERYERSGSLFQGRFKRVHVTSNEQLLYLAAYVNLNNLVHDRKEYCLSSFDAYINKRDESFVKTSLITKQYKDCDDFARAAKDIVQEINKRRKLDRESDKVRLLE